MILQETKIFLQTSWSSSCTEAKEERRQAGSRPEAAVRIGELMLCCCSSLEHHGA